VLQELLRESDYVARLDNKSFVISLLDASLQQTEIVAKRVMRAIEEQDIRIADTSIPVEILCGGAQFDSVQDQQFDDLLLRAENNCQSD
jgi:PleD family two-component response regulator